MVSVPSVVRISLSGLVSKQFLRSLFRVCRLTVPCLAIAFSGAAKIASAQTKTATTTTMTVTSGVGAVTAVTSGTTVTLAASVSSASGVLSTGQVSFCDAAAAYCTDIHLLGTAQLTSAGKATLKFRPGVGSHRYKAIFLGTNANAASSSSAASLTVTGTPVAYPSTTTIAETGAWGQYSLTATVMEIGGTTMPSGTVSFQNATKGNAVLGTGDLGAGTPGLTWLNSQVQTSAFNPRALATGDFNGDGIPDVAELDSASVVVLLGNGDGSFTAAAGGPANGQYPDAMTAGDFNGDGKLDLAVVNNATNSVTILLGNGDGSFSASASSPSTGLHPDGITVGDFNGDGIVDLAVPNTGDNYNNGTVSILLGNGDGTFTAADTSPVVGVNPYAVAVGDFNGDGKADLAVIDQQQDTMTILLGNGDGTFIAAASPQVTSNAEAIAVADFNGDGKQDLIVACSNGGQVFVLLGNGDGTFTTAPAFPSSPMSDTISVVDFNQDGIADVALVNNTYSGAPEVFLGHGDGSFVPSPTALQTSFDPFFLVAADFNGDGRPDMAVLNSNSQALSIYTTESTQTAIATAAIALPAAGSFQVDASYGGDSNYTSSTSSTLPLWGVPSATATTLSVSSGATLVTSVSPGTAVTLTATVKAGTSLVTAGQVNFCDASASQCSDIHLLGSVSLTSAGTATFKFVPGPGVHSYKAVFVEDGYGLSSSSAAATLTVGPVPSPVYTDITSITSTGVPGSYSLTATVLGFGGTAAPTGSVSFLDTSFGNKSLATAQLGTSTAGIGWLVSQTPAANGNALSEVTGDFNADGIPDLALLWSASAYGGPYSVTTFLGKGDGTFTSDSTTQWASTESQLYPNMIAGDFNGDGKADLAVLSWDGDSTSYITILPGNGDGTFGASQTGTVYNQGVIGGDGVPGSMVAADFNGDGKMDLAVVGDYVAPGGVTILLGNGDGTFKAAGPNLAPSGNFGRIASGDFNGDGIPDLVATNYFNYGESPTIFLGKGDGTFTTLSTSFTLDYFPTSLVVADFNGDGFLDLAFSDLNEVEIVLGNGDGTFNETSASPIAVPSELYSLTAGDFNHDGKPDLAGIDSYDGQIDLLLGAGDGTFTLTITTPVVSPTFLGPFALVAGDFNEDGVPDLAMLTKNTATASILLTEPTQTATATVNSIAPAGVGTHNVEASYAGNSTYHSSTSSTVALTAGLAPLVISPAGGTYSSAQTITLSESIPGATIYYEASGPLLTKGFVPYTGPIQLTEGGVETIQAYATETGYQQTDYLFATFTLNFAAAPAPSFSPAAGSYANAQKVTITDAVAGATIYYTNNGSYPSESSTVYTGPITVSTSETIAAVAIAPMYSISKPASAQYLIDSAPSSFIYTIAGTGAMGYSGDGGPATAADLNYPDDTVEDSLGNIYIADSVNNVVRKVAAGSGIITTIAGNGTPGYSGDGGPALNAELSEPESLALDGAGNLYVSDNGNYVIRKVAAATGVITTYAGNGKYEYSGDNGPATSASLAIGGKIAADNAGNLYIAEPGGQRVRKVAVNTGTITTVAGNGNLGYAGDGGAATSAELDYPEGVATDTAGNLYIADTFNNVIRKVNAASGIISTVAGNKSAGLGYNGGYTGDGGPAISAQLSNPQALTVDKAGNLYIADSGNQVIREVSAGNGIITTIAGNGSPYYSFNGDGGPATDLAFFYPNSISVDAGGNLFIAVSQLSRIHEVMASALPPTTQTPAPTFSIPTGTYATAQAVTISDTTPQAAIYLTFDGTTPTALQQIYNGPINVSGAVTIKAIALAPGKLPSAPVTATYTITAPPDAIVSTVAGNGVYGFSGSGGAATAAELGDPNSIAFDSAGNLYFSDYGNSVIWKITAVTGKISVVAGNGTQGFSGDGGLAVNAELSNPKGIAIDSAGNLYIADSNNYRIRKVNLSTGMITTAAGSGQVVGLNGDIGDGGPATAATLAYPTSVALDKSGNLYIADFDDFEVRVVSASTGIIEAYAGNGKDGFSGGGGPATSAAIGLPSIITFDSAGNLYIASDSGWILKVAAGTGIITSIAGNGDLAGDSGDGGPATSAQVSAQGLAVDAAGNLYIATDSYSIRKVAASTGVITRVAGNGYYGYEGDGGSATLAEFNTTAGIAFDAAGNLYIADTGNAAIRKLSSYVAAATPVFSVPAGSYASSQTVNITDNTSGATIYYTTDGTTPTVNSSVYNSPIIVSTSETLKAIAAAPGYANSLVATAAYTIHSLLVPTVSVNPSTATITDQQAVDVTVTVTGANGQPTGSVTLANAAYNSVQSLNVGTATFKIPAGTLAAGANTLTVNYSGDANYDAASGNSIITVAQVVVAAPTPPAVSPGSSTTATVSFATSSTYSGTMNLTCALTASPSGAKSLPTCSLNPGSITITSGSNATSVLTIKTTAASNTALVRPSNRMAPWIGAGGTVLALALLFPLPAKRRKWLSRLSLLLVFAAVGAIGCGGGGGQSSTPPSATPATTAGNYAFTVTGTDSANPKITASTSITVTVQ